MNDLVIQKKLQTVSKQICYIVCVAAIAMLAGWQLDIDILKRPFPGGEPISPITALCFIFSAICLILVKSEQPFVKKFHVDIWLCIIIFSIGLLRIISLALGYDSPLDNLIFSGKHPQYNLMIWSGNMSSLTAVNFMFLATAIWVQKKETEKSILLAHVLTIIIALTGILSILAYLYRVPLYSGNLRYFIMALYTIAGFILLSVALLFASPAMGITQVYTTNFTGSNMARLMTPAAILVPTLLGYYFLIGEWKALFVNDFGDALETFCIIIIFLSLIIYQALLLNKAGLFKQIAIANLHGDLEKKVIARTQELEKSEKLFRALVEYNEDSISMYDEKMFPLYASNSFEKIMGFKQEESRLHTDLENIHADDASLLINTRFQMLTNPGLPVTIEFRAKHKKGHFIWLRTTSINLLSDPNIKAIVVNMRDISVSKNAVEKIKESEARLKEAELAAQLGNWKLNFTTGEATWSDGACRLFGFSPTENKQSAEAWLSLVHPEDLDDVNEKITDANKYLKELVMDYRVILHDARVKYIHSESKYDLDKNGKPVAMFGVVQDVTERKLEEEKILASEEKYRSLIDQASDAICIADASMKFIDLNPYACEIFGYTKQEALNISLPDILFTEDLATNPIRSYDLKAGVLLRSERRLKHKNGTAIEMEVSSTMMENGRLLLFGHDITERKLAEEKHTALLEQLKQTVIELNKIMDSSPDVICAVDQQGNFIKLSAACETVWGYKPEELIGKPLLDYVYKDDKENTQAKAFQVMSGKEFVYFNNRYIKKDGSLVSIEWTARWNDKEKIRYGVARDVTEKNRLETERKKAEILIKESNDALIKTLEEKKMILERIDDSFFAVDKNWVVTYWNSQAEKVLQTPRHKIKNKNLWTVFSSSIDTIAYKKYHEAIETGKVMHFEYHYPDLFKWFEISAYPSDSGLSVYFKDVTERKKSIEEIHSLNTELEKKVSKRTEELQAANMEMQAFTYSVSHDLRAPLRGIIGFAAILEEEYASQMDDEAKRITAVIRNNTLKMGNLVDDLLDFSRVGRQELVKITLNTSEIIKEIIGEFTAGKHNTIEWTVANLPAIEADLSSIRQVWVNLLSNAIKYTAKSPSPHIEIGFIEAETETTFFVKDNGVGFDEKYLHKLFKVFQRLHSTAEFEGSGVGLAIVEKIITKHGGRVWAGARLGKGATFYFSLPK